MRQTKGNRGAILFLVIIFCFILAALGMTVVYMHGMEEMYSKNEVDTTRAQLMAEAGLERAKNWLGNTFKTSWFEGTYGTNPYRLYTDVLMEPGNDFTKGYYSVEITPNPLTTSNPIERYYYIASTGVAGGYVKSIRANIRVSTTAPAGVGAPSRVFAMKTWWESPASQKQF